MLVKRVSDWHSDDVSFSRNKCVKCLRANTLLVVQLTLTVIMIKINNKSFPRQGSFLFYTIEFSHLAKYMKTCKLDLIVEMRG